MQTSEGYSARKKPTGHEIDEELACAFAHTLCFLHEGLAFNVSLTNYQHDPSMVLADYQA